MKSLSSLLFLTVLFAACGGDSQREKDEREGASMLAEARTALSAGRYDAARQSVLTMRKDFPLAMNARKQAILLLDSIELAAAKDSLAQCLAQPVDTAVRDRYKFVDVREDERLSMKVQFFERKLQEDLKKQ